VLWLLAGLIVLGLGGFLWLRAQARGSLPVLTGEITLAGLSAPVCIERDSLGVPTITGRNRRDVGFALGFLHAQERFFQMDLQRRQGAGELAALFGKPALPLDRSARVHQFRRRAQRILAQASSEDLAQVGAYTSGVNAGLAALAKPPFEYLLLRSEPEAWRPEDCALVLFSMFIRLALDNGAGESVAGTLHDVLPAELAAFLAPPGCEWDAPVSGAAIPTPDFPGPGVFDLRRGQAHPPGSPPPTPDPHGFDEPDAPGSNNWAVSGRHTFDGRALLANDMHLGLSIPNIWFRAVLKWPDPENEKDGPGNRVVGVTLPGVPVIVVGSNSHVAWGFTNSFGDWSDLVVLETDPQDENRYLTPDGYRHYDRQQEIIQVRDAPPDTLTVITTIWGPQIDRDYRGRPRVLRWIAHDPEGVNLRQIGLEEACSVTGALDIACRCGVPPQNFVCADREGNIGWTIIGKIPRRIGHDGRRPTSWADGSRRWDGWLEPAEYPRLVNPAPGIIWTANARVVGGPMLARIGDGGYALGARATQIRDRLAGLESAGERDLLAIQLDHQALFLRRWRELVLSVLTGSATGDRPDRAEFRRLVDRTWTGYASVESAGYRLVRAFRNLLHRHLYGWLTAPCAEADSLFDPLEITQREGPVWKLVSERPLHLLDPVFPTWEDALLAAVDSTVAYFTREDRPLAACTWGERNTTAIRHPLSRFVPGLGRWTDMPARPLPGDGLTPRAQSPTFGASERLVVSPGHEEDGLFHMPGGQSGHPLSPYWGTGHEAWEEGRPTPLLPGATRWTLFLLPDA